MLCMDLVVIGGGEAGVVPVVGPMDTDLTGGGDDIGGEVLVLVLGAHIIKNSN